MFIDPNKPYYAKGERTSVCSNYNKPEVTTDDNDIAVHEVEQTSVCSNYNKPEVTTDDNDIAVHEVEQTSVCSNHNKLISPFMR
jgi:hypothetical protein